MRLMSVKVDGAAVSETNYQVTEKKLVIRNLPKGSFVLEIETGIKPQVRNTSLYMKCI